MSAPETNPEPAVQKPQPILRLDENERDFILVHKKRYDLLSLDDLGVRDYHRITHLSQEFNSLYRQPELDDEEFQRLEDLIEEMLPKVVVKMPVTVQRKLSWRQQTDIVAAFTMLPLLRGMQAAAETEETEAERVSSTTES